MKIRASIALLALCLTQGCVYYYPVTCRKNVKPIIGRTVTTIQPLYLAKEGPDYLLLPHDDPIYDAPSFEDFRAGRWRYSYWKHRFNYKEIVPANTPFTIRTVWEEFHCEVGCSYLVYGRFTDEYPGTKPRKVVLWKTMSDNILAGREARHFRSDETGAQQD